MASKYPERPEMRYMSHKTASEIKELNEKAGRVVPVEQIKKIVNKTKVRSNISIKNSILLKQKKYA